MFSNNIQSKLLLSNKLFVCLKCCASLSRSYFKHTEANLVLPEYETKLLQVGIIGVPNAGKSTFINNLMDRKVCSTSSKVHTTRSKSMAIFTEGDAQIIFLDTPGLVNDREQKRYKLEPAFSKDAKKVLKEADVIGVIHDVSNIYTRERLDIKIIKLLEYHKQKPSFLVFNKIDILKSKRKLLDLTRILTDNCIDGKPIPSALKQGRRIEGEFSKNEYKGWPYFQEIFMVSALTGDGLADIRKYLIRNAKPSKWMFPEEVWTDQSAESIVTNAVKAKLLDFLPQEIPYSLKTELEYFDINDEGVISTVVLIKSPSSRTSKLVAGTANGKLRQITESVQQDLQDAFQNYVKIRLILNPSPE